MYKLFRSHGFFFVALAVISAPVAAFAIAIRERIDRFLTFAFDLISEKVAFPRLDFGARLFGGQRFAYDGPTMDLRHEAMTSRRSAARNT